MKIKTSLFLSYVSFIILIILLVLSLKFFLMDLTNKNIHKAKNQTLTILKQDTNIFFSFFKNYVEKEIILYTQKVLNITIKLNWQKPQEILENPITINTFYTPLEREGKIRGYFFVINKTGNIVIYPQKKYINRNLNALIAVDPEYNFFLSNLLKNASTLINYEDGDKIPDVYLITRTIPNTNYTLCGVFLLNNYLSPFISELNAIGLKITEDLDKTYNKTINNYNLKINIAFIFILIVCLLISFSFAFYFSKTLSKPIAVFSDAVNEIGNGNFSFNLRIDKKAPLEIIGLTEKFNELGTKLNQYTLKLKKEILSRKEINNELKVAKNIQTSFLPKVLPHSNFFNFNYFFNPAKNISGDFFDVILINETLFITIGDISGKSISAALFMAITNTCIKLNIIEQKISDPAKILNTTNNYLSKNNDNCFFASAIVLAYDIKTGKITFANAGHLSPIYIAENIEILPTENDLALGIKENWHYKNQEFSLKPTDKLLLYTDGVTEAISKLNRNEYFEETRLLKTLKKNKTANIKDLITNLKQEILKFQGLKQADDIAIIGLERLQ